MDGGSIPACVWTAAGRKALQLGSNPNTLSPCEHQASTNSSRTIISPSVLMTDLGLLQPDMCDDDEGTGLCRTV